MKIEVLGTGCAKCKTALRKTSKRPWKRAARRLRWSRCEDIPSIMKYGVMSTPALVIDGQVKFSGKIASRRGDHGDAVKQSCLRLC